MCGICGFIADTPVSEEQIFAVRQMNQALLHRGPDSEGFYNDANIALAMRRLKIIDIEGGEQPLFNEDSSLALVANGEIYNSVELREELEKQGHIFKTRSDVETILHLYEEKGEDCVHSLRGMFAFVLYDKKKQKVFFARDRLSEKPFYFYKSDEELVFSSEMNSLLVYLRPRGIEIDHDSINMYFHYQFVPEPFTCIKGVNKLPAAHYMTLSMRDFSLVQKKYWDIEDVEPLSGHPPELIREAFDELTKLVIRADVPVGLSLSGGIDSTAIACFAKKHYGDNMHAFSVGYSGRPANDERRKAENLARKLGLHFHDIELKTEDLVSFFPELVYHMDDPIADIAAFGYYSVSKLAREKGVPVLLTGFGGDELFWGYEWVRKTVEKNFLKQEIQSGRAGRGNLFAELLQAFRNTRKKDMLFHPLLTVKSIAEDAKKKGARYFENPSRFIFYDEVPDFDLAFDFINAIGAEDFKDNVDNRKLYSFFTSDGEWDNLPIKTCNNLFQTWLYSNCIALGDRMSMASSVESRLPFMDHKLVELVMGLRKTYHDDYKLGYKQWFIEAMKGVIPDEVLKRKKRGFTPPVDEWYSAIVKHYGELCYDGCLVSMEIMKKQELINFITGAFSIPGKLFFAYKLVLLELWLRKVVEGEKYA